MTRMQRGARAAAVALFLVIVFVAVPLAIYETHRSDLYYTLSSVALLAIASGGVWLTFYIGRINIGQGAYALAGGYVSAVLISTYGLSFWLSLPLAGLFCALISVLIGLPILRLRGVYFSMVTLVLTEVARLSALALPITNGASGITSIPMPGAIRLFGLTIVPSFDSFAEPNVAFYFLSVTMMTLCFAALYRRGEFTGRPAVRGAAPERGARVLDGRQRPASARARLCHLVVSRRDRRRDLRRHRPVDLPVELHRQRQRELHAQLLPRRLELRIRSRCSGRWCSISVGTSCSRPASISS